MGTTLAHVLALPGRPPAQSQPGRHKALGMASLGEGEGYEARKERTEKSRLIMAAGKGAAFQGNLFLLHGEVGEELEMGKKNQANNEAGNKNGR